ncbi:hypothetical protein B296_00058523 [Ensete ventricosum]|uniref:Uncharacterized protein n=1 Tax=Ensete ventricosum TaxID=4639 RepID=A0A426XLV3_ENSVE|nr:hypothetical protein B296_00058523 [Ensete ventricosum]
MRTARYRAVLSKSTVADRFRPVLAEGGRKKRREKNLVPQRDVLPRFPRAIYRQWAKNCLRDPSPVTGGRFLLPARGEGI